MAKLAACNTGTKTVVADGDGVVLEVVGKVILAFGHGTNEDADALVGCQCLDVVSWAYDGGFKRQGHLPAVGWQVIGDGILDDFEKLLLRVG